MGARDGGSRRTQLRGTRHPRLSLPSGAAVHLAARPRKQSKLLLTIRALKTRDVYPAEILSDALQAALRAPPASGLSSGAAPAAPRAPRPAAEFPHRLKFGSKLRGNRGSARRSSEGPSPESRMWLFLRSSICIWQLNFSRLPSCAESCSPFSLLSARYSSRRFMFIFRAVAEKAENQHLDPHPAPGRHGEEALPAGAPAPLLAAGHGLPTTRGLGKVLASPLQALAPLRALKRCRREREPPGTRLRLRRHPPRSRPGRRLKAPTGFLRCSASSGIPRKPLFALPPAEGSGGGGSCRHEEAARGRSWHQFT